MADAEAAVAVTPAPPGGKTPVELRDMADRLRGRVDLTGRLLAVLGTTAAAAVGLNRIGDLYPNNGTTPWVVAAVAGIVLATLGILWVATRLTKVSRPLLLRADLDAMVRDKEIGRCERKLIRPLYERAARDAGAASLATVELRLATLERLVRRTADLEQRRRLTRMAEEIRADLDLVYGRALVIVVRRRAAKAVTGARSWAAYLLVIGGLLAFALGTDKVTSNRSVEIAASLTADARAAADSSAATTAAAEAARACAEARAAGATPGELLFECSAWTAQPVPQASEDKRATTAVALLGALTRTCETTRPTATTEAAICGPLRRTIATLLAP